MKLSKRALSTQTFSFYALLCLCSLLPATVGLVVSIPAANPASSLLSITLPVVNRKDGTDEHASTIDIGSSLSETLQGDKTMLILATHAADFNTVEYLQKLRAFWSELQDRGVKRCIVVINGNTNSCAKVCDLVDLPDDTNIIICADPSGNAGRSFGVSRGWRPDDEDIPAILKTTVVGLGFGPPWGTLGAVLPGYFGQPQGRREWIDSALRQGQLADRWPSVLDLDESGNIIGNKFDDFPGLSDWGVRPLELATLRLQNLIGIQIKHWDKLKPDDDRCLTQLGGCAVVGEKGDAIFSWVDRGLCDVPDFHDILSALDVEDQ